MLEQLLSTRDSVAHPSSWNPSVALWPAARIRIFVLPILFATIVVGTPSLFWAPLAHGQSTSWNPNVSCSATLVTIQDILGSAYPSQSLGGSGYQTNSTGGGIPDKRALSPQCTITNINGQTISSFVQINGVTLHNYFYETRDCGTKYNAVNGGHRYPNGETLCDSTGNIYAVGTSSGYVHIEIDRDWMAAAYAGPSTTYDNNNTIAQVNLPCTISKPCSSPVSIDVQGFVYWDGGDSPPHWELHALTAWRTPHPTVTSVACPSSATVGVTFTCSATVTDTSSSGATIPTGTATFNPSGSCNLAGLTSNSASCSVNITQSSTGPLSVFANYPGDPTHSASSGSVTVTINPRATMTSVSCPPSAKPADSTTCAATVADTSPGTASTPTGIVIWNNTNRGVFINSTCTLSLGSCTVGYTPLDTGSHVITGSYDGDPTHAASSGRATIEVAIDSTATYVSCTPDSVAINQATDCTAIVNDTSTIPTNPTGNVGFTSNGGGSVTPSSCSLTPVTGSTRLSSCSGTFTGSAMGTESVTGNYSGDSSHGTSSGTSNTITVNLRATSLYVNCTPTNVVVNNATRCTATVTDTDVGSPITPTGTVTLATNSTGTFSTACTLAGSSTSATCTVTYTPETSAAVHPRTDTIIASYAGDANHTASPTGSAAITVNSRDTSISVSCAPDTISEEQSTTCIAIVTDTSPGTSITPTGTVTFTSSPVTLLPSPITCNLSTSATCSVNITAPADSGNATYTITASYAGDKDHYPASNTFSQTVTSGTVGGVLVPVDNLTILEPFIGLVSVTLTGVAATVPIYRRRIARKAS